LFGFWLDAQDYYEILACPSLSAGLLFGFPQFPSHKKII
jgi:hypothetical protein